MKDLPSFEVMTKLAKNHPKLLEDLRQDMINELIDSAPLDKQRRLRGLQFKIDMEIRKSKTPVASCMQLSKMMMESFSELSDALHAIKEPSKETENNAEVATFSKATTQYSQPGKLSTATVIPLCSSVKQP